MASIRRQAKDLNNVYSSTTLPYTTTTTATTWISKTSVWKSIHLFVLVIVLPIVLDSYQTCSRSVLRIFFKNLGGPGRRADCSNHSARKMMMMGWWDDLEKWNRDLYRTVFFSSFTILFFFCRAKNIFFSRLPLTLFFFLSGGVRRQRIHLNCFKKPWNTRRFSTLSIRLGSRDHALPAVDLVPFWFPSSRFFTTGETRRDGRKLKIKTRVELKNSKE